MSIPLLLIYNFTKIALLGLTHFFGTVSIPSKCAETLHEGRDARPEDEGKVHAGHQGPNGLKGAYSRT